MTNTLHPLGFLDAEAVQATVAQEHHAALADANDRLTRIVSDLGPKVAEVKESKSLTTQGKAERLRALAERADRDARAVVKQKQAAVEAWLVQTESGIASSLSPAQPERVQDVREDVRLLVGAHPQASRGSQLMTDSEGRVFVTGQDAVIDTLLNAASQGDPENSKLTVAAVRHGSPVLQGLVGGQPIIDEMVRRLTERVAGPSLARQASLESLRDALDSNVARAKAHILDLTDLRALHSEDPVAESAAGA